MKKLTFYIDKFCIINDKSQIDLKSFFATKRRLSLSDQAAVSATDTIFNDNVKEIIFASEYGEFTRLNQIIDEYKTNNEVSPIKFSGSVHNYPVGCFNFTKKLNIPYQAISAGHNTVSCALVKSIISPNPIVLMCYAENFNDELKCVSCIISKHMQSDNAIECEFEKTYTTHKNDEYLDFCRFLKNDTDVFISNLGIVRKVQK